MRSCETGFPVHAPAALSWLPRAHARGSVPSPDRKGGTSKVLIPRAARQRVHQQFDIFLGSQRTHDADAKDLAGQRAETAGDVDTMFVQQTLAGFHVVD